MHRFAEALRNCGISVREVYEPNMTVLSGCLDDATRGKAEIVHVLSHGVWDQGSNRLRVAARGAEGTASLGNWVDLRSWLADVVLVEGPPLLVLLDVCSGGSPTTHGWLDGEKRTVWLLGAAEPGFNAYKARFTVALTAVLRRVAAGDDLGTDFSWKYLSLDLFSRAVWDELVRICEEDDALPQRLATSRHQLGRSATAAFFKNPGFTSDPILRLRRQMDQVLVTTISAVDPVLGATHYRSRAAGTRPDRPMSRCLFTGRERELEKLSNWFDKPAGDHGLRIVTGGPGTGKSALLGVLACLTHPDLRPFAEAIEQGIPARLKPRRRKHGHIAAVHARNRTSSELLRSITSQLVGILPRAMDDIEDITEAQQNTYIERLTEELRAAGTQPIIILDALDEAADPVGLLLSLIQPIATARMIDGSPVCRLLIGTRKQRRLVSLFDLPETGEDGLIDLDDIPNDRVSGEVYDYVAELIRQVDGQHPSWDAEETNASTIRVLTEQVAEAVSGEQAAAYDIGPFLLAQLYLHQVMKQPAPRTTEDAEFLGRLAPRSVTEALRWQQSAKDSSPWLRPLLAGFAHAKGTGIPARLARLIAQELAPGLARPSSSEIDQAMEMARFYLRSEVDDDGSTIYGLFHQALQDHLWEHPYGDGVPWVDYAVSTGSRSAAERVFATLLTEFRSETQLLDGDDKKTSPYLYRHLGEHAIDAGRFDVLATSPDYLSRAEPENLLRDFRMTTAVSVSREAATVYLNSEKFHRKAVPSQRLKRLIVDAVGLRAYNLYEFLVTDGPGMGSPRWATSEASPYLADVIPSGVTGVVGIDCALLEGRPIAIVASRNGSIRLWDLAAGTQLTQFLGKAGNDLTSSVLCIEVDGRSVFVSARKGGSSWDIRGGDELLIGDAARRDEVGRFIAFSSVEVDGQPFLVTSSTNGALQVWDLAEGAEKAAEIFGRHQAMCAVTGGDSVIVTGGADGVLRSWLVSPDFELEQQMITEFGQIDSITYATVDGRPLAIVGATGGSVALWDLFSGDVLKRNSFHTRGASVLVECISFEDSVVAVIAGRDGSLWAWSLVDDKTYRIGRASSVDAITCALVKGRPTVISCGNDGNMYLWDLSVSMDTQEPSVGHSAEVWQTACVAMDERELLITGGYDNVVNVFDLESGLQFASSTIANVVPPVGLTCLRVDDTEVTVTCSGRSVIEVWDLRTGIELDQSPFETTAPVDAVTSADIGGAPIVITGDRAGRIQAWDLRTGTRRGGPVDGHTGPITAVRFAHLEKQPVVITGGYDSAVRIWDPSTFEQRGEALQVSGGVIIQLAAGGPADAPVLATCGREGTLDVWNLATRAPVDVQTLDCSRYARSVECANLDGRPVVIVGSHYGSLSLLDIETGECTTFAELRSPVFSITCTHDAIAVSFGTDVAVLNYPGIRVSG